MVKNKEEDLMKNLIENWVYIVIIILGIILGFVLTSLESVSAVEIIDPDNPNPFLNETNQTEDNGLNDSINYLEGITDETSRKLIEALVNATNSNQEEKEFSDAIRKSFVSGQKDFTDALGKIEYLVSEVISERDKAVSDKEEYIRTTKIRMETLETEVDSLRLGNERLKAWVFFYIILGLTFGVLTMEIASYIRKNQKGYFIIRAIRDKIPLKF